jgi:hypothetical protein
VSIQVQRSGDAYTKRDGYSFSSRLAKWRRAYKAQVFKWYCISPWAKADELVLYVFAIGELKQSGLKAAEMGWNQSTKSSCAQPQRHCSTFQQKSTWAWNETSGAIFSKKVEPSEPVE